MKKDVIALVAGLIVILLLGGVIIYQAEIFGVSEGRLVADARNEQKISKDWDVKQSKNDEMCAMIFYDARKENYSYSVYLKNDGMSFGYFYREGGQNPYIEEGVQGIFFEDKGIALLSMNEEKVARVVVENGADKKAIPVDPEAPFALVFPPESNAITLYDSDDNVITLYDKYS
ncbi:MAG: hypothetical protein MJ114_01010 [Acetatifactor sp.]|nr:hypothetical protein [Acetatifactor sp.]